MSFQIYAQDDLILAQYEPEHGTDFLFREFGLNSERAFDGATRQMITQNEEAFRKGQTDHLTKLFTADHFVENFRKCGFYLTKETLSSKVLAKKFNFKKRLIFTLGFKDGDYFRIPKYFIYGYHESYYIQYDILIHKDVVIENSLFYHDSKNNYFGILNFISPETEVIIGGPREGAIPESDFRALIEKLPTRHGYRYYMRGQIQSLFSEYLDIKQDYIEKYKKYMNGRSSGKNFQIFEEVRELEVQKYIFIRDKLKDMLANVEKFSESDWQKQIFEIVMILFPKYSQVLKEVIITTPQDEERRLDFAILDHDGHLDVIEIKQPFEYALVTKNRCRNNFVPLKELSTTVIQAEKYLFYLSKWGKRGEQVLTERYKEVLNPNIGRIKITNPKAILILGRDSNLSDDQKDDLQIIRRHYSNISDILTYDDLLRRLTSLITSFSKKEAVDSI